MAIPPALLSSGGGGLSVDAGSEAHSRTGPVANGVNFSSPAFSDKSIAIVALVVLAGMLVYVRGNR